MTWAAGEDHTVSGCLNTEPGHTRHLGGKNSLPASVPRERTPGHGGPTQRCPQGPGPQPRSEGSLVAAADRSRPQIEFRGFSCFIISDGRGSKPRNHQGRHDEGRRTPNALEIKGEAERKSTPVQKDVCPLPDMPFRPKVTLTINPVTEGHRRGVGTHRPKCWTSQGQGLPCWRLPQPPPRTRGGHTLQFPQWEKAGQSHLATVLGHPLFPPFSPLRVLSWLSPSCRLRRKR